MNPCTACGAPHASFGVGPPAQAEQGWYCGACILLHPARQKALAVRARELLDDPEIIIF